MEYYCNEIMGIKVERIKGVLLTDGKWHKTSNLKVLPGDYIEFEDYYWNPGLVRVRLQDVSAVNFFTVDSSLEAKECSDPALAP